MILRVPCFVLGLLALAPLGYGQSAGRASISAQLPAKAPGRYVESMKIGTFDRSYILRVPKQYDATKPLPLVVVLHGWTSNATQAEVYTGMGEESDRRGFVLAVPDGLGPKGMQGWNAEFLNLSLKGVDDVAFVDALIDKIESEVGVDKDRVFIAGHSNGAFMANLLGAKLSAKVAAIASVAGTVGIPDPNSDSGFKTIPEPAYPVSAILFHGTADPMVQYDSSTKSLLHGVSAMNSAKFWAKSDGCRLAPTETKSSNGVIVTDLWSGGKKGAEVELITIIGGVHDWPGGLTRSGPELRTGLNAADMIWDFFKKHPKSH